jgi:hypothetical protein|tara:strand:+ start:1024 stop:2550 length:1527 start_codon:yes stop_codon:yes gene_type:complete
MAELFGFKIERIKQPTSDPRQNIVPPSADDGTQTVPAGGFFASYGGFDAGARNELDLIRRYREVALHPECDMAVEDIVNEAITSNENQQSVSLDLTKTEYSNAIKEKIRLAFREVLLLLQFDIKGHDIFRRWYVDGRVFYHKIIDAESPRLGLTELRYIDPRKIKKVREMKRGVSMPVPGMPFTAAGKFNEFYMFNERGIHPTAASNMGGIKIAPDSITYCPSGLVDQQKNMVLSYLHKAIKPVNQLRMIEDAVVIYRIARAPERRIFYIDVGNLPKIKAEQYLRDIMSRYRNKLVYDASTGEIRDDRNYMSMLEDFWLPRREGGRGTEITTLPGGQNLGEIADIEYFKQKLYRSLNVPISRLESGQGFNMGRAAEISRDELKFTKFVGRLRKKFTMLFHDLLKTQLVLKGVISIEEWDLLQQQITYTFLQDGFFAELKNAEIMRERVALVREVEPYIGKYFSNEYVRTNLLKQTELDIDKQDKQMEIEKVEEPEQNQGEEDINNNNE